MIFEDKDGKVPEDLIIDGMKIQRKPEFFEYVKSGFSSNLAVVFDFTASNENVYNPKSLHFVKTPTNNVYFQAAECVERHLRALSNEKYAFYGFGGRRKGMEDVIQCFPFSGTDLKVDGIGGLLEAYQAGLQIYELFGPTQYSHVIKHIVDEARKEKEMNNLHYTTVVFVTDGIIEEVDIQPTIE